MLASKHEEYLRNGWQEAAIRHGQNGSASIRGPLGVVIDWLKHLGWKPLNYNLWHTHVEHEYFIYNKSQNSGKTIINALIDRSNSLDAVRAHCHYCGEGMESGIDWSLSTQWYRSKHISYQQKCGFETIAAAAFWPNLRVHQINPEVSKFCDRCGGTEIDTPLHCFWSCPANGTIEAEEVASTQGLVAEAEAHFQDLACLWIRGLIPYSLTKAVLDQWQPSEDLHLVTSSVGGAVKISDTITVYGDASGGKFTRYAALRRVGVGIVSIDQEGNVIWGQRFNLPGKVQTVARGELYAIVRAAHLAEEYAEIDFVTDNLGNCMKFNAGREKALLSNNGDMFKSLFEEILLKQLDFAVRWMPSHSERKGIDLPPEVTPLDVKGNDFADKQADLAAEEHVINLNASSVVLNYSSLAQRIQKRNVCIMASLGARKKGEVIKTDKISPNYLLLLFYFLFPRTLPL